MLSLLWKCTLSLEARVDSRAPRGVSSGSTRWTVLRLSPPVRSPGPFPIDSNETRESGGAKLPLFLLSRQATVGNGQAGT